MKENEHFCFINHEVEFIVVLDSRTDKILGSKGDLSNLVHSNTDGVLEKVAISSTNPQ